MILVLDASAAVRSVLDQDPRRWRQPLASADLVLAPSLFPAEVANTFWKYVHSGVMARDVPGAALCDALGLVDEFREIHELAGEAFDLGVLMKRPVYDMFYLVLARRHSAVLLSADNSLCQAAKRAGIKPA